MHVCVAKAGDWPEADCALMLQCVRILQEVYLSQSIEDSVSYVKVKSAVLKAFRLVLESYHQRFRSWERCHGQTCVEYVPLLKIYVN